MNRVLSPELNAKIREATEGLPPYGSGPGVDYTNALVAYAVNVTLLAGQLHYRDNLYVPTPKTQALLVRRGAGDGMIGSLSGVSGFIDTVHDPTDVLSDEDFDPVAYGARREFAEECGISEQQLDSTELFIGNPFSEPRHNGTRTEVLPLIAIYARGGRPTIQPDGREVTDYTWVPLAEIAGRPDLSNGYLHHTLPGALGALGIRGVMLDELLGTR